MCEMLFHTKTLSNIIKENQKENSLYKWPALHLFLITFAISIAESKVNVIQNGKPITKQRIQK